MKKILTIISIILLLPILLIAWPLIGLMLITLNDTVENDKLHQTGESDQPRPDFEAYDNDYLGV